MREYFKGKKLYGDDFTKEKILQWFKDEEKAYYELLGKTRDSYVYGYTELNKYYGFNKIRHREFNHVLGIGAAYGDELIPILDKIKRVTILKSANEYISSSITGGVAVEYKKPDPLGTIPFPDETFDLITCFGVLHHIPNVTKVLKEMQRVLTSRGIVLL